MSNWRGKKERIMLCNSWQESKLTKAEFCRQNNIRTKTFYRWISEFKDNSKVKLATVRNDTDCSSLNFIPINNLLSKKTTAIDIEKSFIEITLPNKVNFKTYLSSSAVNEFLKELLQWK